MAETMTFENYAEILLSDARGIYIPRDFVTQFDIADDTSVVNGWRGIDPKDIAICENPDHEWYWEAWQDICDSAYYIDTKGVRFNLYQNGDLFMVPEGVDIPEF